MAGHAAAHHVIAIWSASRCLAAQHDARVAQKAAWSAFENSPLYLLEVVAGENIVASTLGAFQIQPRARLAWLCDLLESKCMEHGNAQLMRYSCM